MATTFQEVKTSFKKHIHLYKALYKDARTPPPAKALLWLAIGYALLPFDLIPDFIPIIGHLDDIVIVPTLLFLALKLIPKEIYDEHKNKIFKDVKK